VVRQFSEMAKETVTAENITGHWYVYGSELAVLRIAHEMRCGWARYSENLQRWYYTTAR
jgi:hypothetical protein